ncbi:osmotically inducible protein OsmC [Brachybacterium vulturis]|uniref:Osmotically inducible protein OsmC n=2 Tax=Brachybacterium vulturis TaxID=2017484 RepID=A0A291GNZ4_9MICO|nr:OsmC family protein [Brachybacterium vulturis]ATG51887.1 osmotically inducible protein OsmC [Brachybacterium vulturis]
MTITASIQSAVPEITVEDRAARLTDAGNAWAERIDANRSNAHLNYAVEGIGAGSVATTVRAGKHSFVVDEPAVLAGDDIGSSPVEYALGALVGCQVVVYRLYAQQLGIPFDDIVIRAEADLDAARLFGADESVRAGFSEVRLDIEISGPETNERYDELREAVDAHCPVLDIFQNPTPVKTTVIRA